jgi:hypothetical protein
MARRLELAAKRYDRDKLPGITELGDGFHNIGVVADCGGARRSG